MVETEIKPSQTLRGIIDSKISKTSLQKRSVIQPTAGLSTEAASRRNGSYVVLSEHNLKIERLLRPRSPLWRLRSWQTLLVVLFLIVLGRLYYLQIFKGNQLYHEAMVQRQQNNLLVHRGTITDRHGLPLAIDTTRYDVYIHPDLLRVNFNQAADVFAKTTCQDREKIRKLLASGSPVITLARHLEREAVDELQSLNWSGIDVVARPFRHYPEGELASHVLGYINVDGLGQGGIEQSLETKLKDTGSITKPQLDGHGCPIPLPTEAPSNRIKNTVDGVPPLGNHIELTIDNYLQHLAENELLAMTKHSHAQRGTAIITNPKTGEILAWANYPTFDPNQYSKYPYESIKNWSMVDVYQPGSTFKILTLASALDLGTIKPTTTFYDSGSLRIGNRTVHNHDGGHGQIDLLHLLIHSSNVGAAQVAMTMTPKQFHDKLQLFGLGRSTGIELPGESDGLLLPSKDWRPIDQATTGFGQGAIAVTPLQLVAAVGAIANEGVLIEPHIVRRIYDPRSGVTEKWTQSGSKKVVDSATAKLMCSLLSKNIAMGSQIAGQIPGYTVAGKTGTAQKTGVGGHGYLAGQTVASFIGFLPANKPQLLCLVVVDGPQTDGRWGNTVAGPVFNAIGVEAARYLGIVPDVPNQSATKSKRNIQQSPSVKYANENIKYLSKTPNVTDQSISKVKRNIQEPRSVKYARESIKQKHISKPSRVDNQKSLTKSEGTILKPPPSREPRERIEL
jgi:cell division protein FtsI/penicillin-binding protein 2